MLPLGDRDSAPSALSDPSQISNKQITKGEYGMYVAGRIFDREQFGKTFTVGKKEAKRKRRALAGTDPILLSQLEFYISEISMSIKLMQLLIYLCE